MAIQITILGLGRVGTSLGLALSQSGSKDLFVLVGSDRDPDVGRRAQKLGAVDKVVFNIPAAVEPADVVLLDLPVDEIRSTLETIAPLLKAGAVVLDTSTAPGKVSAWAQELLPPDDRYFLTFTPTTNPLLLLEPAAGIDAARQDLFKNSLVLITSLPGTDESALTLAESLAKLAGATTMIADAAEADGLLASSHLLPEILAAALVNATADQPGWREAQKVAGPAFARVSEPLVHLDALKLFGQSTLHNAENSVRVIDNLIAELTQVREVLAARDEQGVHDWFERARAARSEWWSRRADAKWDEADGKSASPNFGSALGRLFGIRPRNEKNHKK